MAIDRNWYEVLHVSPTAPPELIKKSFQVLAQHGHPDKGGDGIDMQDLTLARDILLDPARRKAFDDQLAAEAAAEAERSRQESARQPRPEEPVVEEVIDDWGQEEAWVPGTGAQPPPPHEPQYQPTWQPEQGPPGPGSYYAQQPPPQHGSPYGQQFAYTPTPVARRAGKEDLVGLSRRARVSGIVLLVASALPIVLGQLTGAGIDDAIFLLVLLGLGLLAGRSFVEGRKTWPFVVWVVLSVIFTLSMTQASLFSGIFFGVWTGAYIVSVLSRRSDFDGG